MCARVERPTLFVLCTQSVAVQETRLYRIRAAVCPKCTGIDSIEYFCAILCHQIKVGMLKEINIVGVIYMF